MNRKNSILRQSKTMGTLSQIPPEPTAVPSPQNSKALQKQASQVAALMALPKNQEPVENNVGDNLRIQVADLPDKLIQPTDDYPSVSPRDKLSYVDDKKVWKELRSYEKNFAMLNVLVGELESAVLLAKPDDIPTFIAETFFAERNLISLRKTIDERMQSMI